MFVILILFIVLFAGAAVVALVRGLIAFGREGDLIRGGDEDAYLRRGEQQNKMMTQRVMFQALAVLMVTALGLLFAAK